MHVIVTDPYGKHTLCKVLGKYRDVVLQYRDVEGLKETEKRSNLTKGSGKEKAEKVKNTSPFTCGFRNLIAWQC